MACVMGAADNQPPATTAFARSRLPRSLLNAHSAAPGVWFAKGVKYRDEAAGFF